MPHRLHEDEDGPQREGRTAAKPSWDVAVGGAGRRRRERRQDEGERRERDERGERGPGALHAERLLAVPQASDEDADPDDAVRDDHDGREDRVPRESRLAEPESIIERISEASITVTATARTRVPMGSPTRWATTSAWWTEAMTAPTSPAAQRRARKGPVPAAPEATRRTTAGAGTSQAQRGIAGSYLARRALRPGTVRVPERRLAVRLEDGPDAFGVADGGEDPRSPGRRARPRRRAPPPASRRGAVPPRRELVLGQAVQEPRDLVLDDAAGRLARNRERAEEVVPRAVVLLGGRPLGGEGADEVEEAASGLAPSPRSGSRSRRRNVRRGRASRATSTRRT